MHVLRSVGAEHFLGRVAQHAAHRIAAEGEFAVAIVLPDPVLRRRDDVAQLLFQAHARAADGRFVQRPAHRRRQSRHVGLEHVVVGAALQRIDGALFADGAGEEDERGVGRELARDLERGEAVEPGQGEIGKDEVGAAFRERAPKHGLGIHALPVAGETACLELTDGDLRLRRHVFHQNQSDRLHCFASPR